MNLSWTTVYRTNGQLYNAILRPLVPTHAGYWVHFGVSVIYKLITMITVLNGKVKSIEHSLLISFFNGSA